MAGRIRMAGRIHMDSTSHITSSRTRIGDRIIITIMSGITQDITVLMIPAWITARCLLETGSSQFWRL